jgi:hypothetical protein
MSKNRFFPIVMICAVLAGSVLVSCKPSSDSAKSAGAAQGDESVLWSNLVWRRMMCAAVQPSLRSMTRLRS